MRIMSKLAILLLGALGVGAATVVTVGVESRSSGNGGATATAAATPETPNYLPKILREPSLVDKPTEKAVISEASKTAWAFVDRGYSPKTGFVVANADWPYPTIWDIASALGAFYSARGLGYITDAEYHKRTKLVLETLNNARLYNGIAYGRNYDARTGELVGADQKPSQNGTGYSSMDLGRLLVWLKIVSQDPALAPLAEQAARRLNAKQVIQGGYLQGEELVKGKVQKYQEGRLGYEQYAAKGFALWGMQADRALRMSHNVKKVNVKGIPVWSDKRGLDRLTSEPFIMQGLEVGLEGEMQELAWQTLALQAKRYEETGQITIASEDALNDKPHYFYYYCVYCSGKAYTINVHTPGIDLDSPRWISSKASYAWHVLLPSKYTWMAVEAVHPAHWPGKGWSTGVYEGTNKSTDVMSLNTAALILESALYYKTGKPFLKS